MPLTKDEYATALSDSAELASSVAAVRAAARQADEKCEALRTLADAVATGTHRHRQSEQFALKQSIVSLEAQLGELEANPPKLFGKGGHEKRVGQKREEVAATRTALSQLQDEIDHELERMRVEFPVKLAALEAERARLQEEKARAEESLGSAQARLDEFTEAPYRRCQALIRELMVSYGKKDRLHFIDTETQLKSAMSEYEQLLGACPATNRPQLIYQALLDGALSDWTKEKTWEQYKSVEESVRPWLDSETDDELFEFACAYTLVRGVDYWAAMADANPNFGNGPFWGRSLLKGQLGVDPLDVAERKLLHVLRMAMEDYTKIMANSVLDRCTKLSKQS